MFLLEIGDFNCYNGKPRVVYVEKKLADFLKI